MRRAHRAVAGRGAIPVLVLMLAFLLTQRVGADVVVPSPDVTTRVIVRASATSQSAQIGSLRPGEQLELIGSVPNWHEVRLPNGTPGFVSKRWTRVIPTVTPPKRATAATVRVFARRA